MKALTTSLSSVLDQVGEANAALAEWHAKGTDILSGRTYVAAGHRCIAAIDAAVRALHDTRAQLVGELRQDADERAARVDLLLAEIRAERAGRHTEEFRPEEMPARGTVRFGEVTE